jgi:hypothetical protein
MRAVPRCAFFLRFTVSTLLAIALACSTLLAADAPVVLDNSKVRLECDSLAGTILRILDKASGIELAPPSSLAESFRLTLLLPDNKTATVIGKDQKLSDAALASDKLTLTWAGPLKDTSGDEYNISVRIDVTAADNALSFSLHLDNQSKCKVKDVLYPMIGGLAKVGPPGKPADGVLWVPTSTPWVAKIGDGFGSPRFAYPGQANMSFTCIQSAAAGKSLYFASHDKIARYKLYCFDEQTAGNAKDVRGCIQHHPFTPPGKSFDGSKVVVRVVDGDWHAAGKVYRTWFERTFGICKPSQSWIRRQSFFQMTMFELPEGTICLRFKDIPQWAKDAKDHGVNSVQISGWHPGGHDNGYPLYTPDPRLGTWQELEDGIKACHLMGMKVYFFVNYQPVMLQSDWYKNELSKYREWGDPNGSITWNTGWPMGTLWGRMGNPKRMTWADPAFPQFRKIIVDQFAKLAAIGADGVHVDKMFPSAIDYNPNLPMSPDTAAWEGAIILTQEVMAACRKLNPDWAMSFECNWDRMLQFSGATWWVGNQLITRRVFPENAETLLIAMPYDYLGVNNAVRDGNIVMLGPLNFCRSMGWAPWRGLSDYIKELKRIQDGLADTVFFGEVLDHEGVRIAAPVPGVDYRVFRNTTTGKHACIFTNSKLEPAKQKIEGFAAGQSGEVRIHSPFQKPKTLKLPAEIEIPAERIVFVEER